MHEGADSRSKERELLIRWAEREIASGRMDRALSRYESFLESCPDDVAILSRVADLFISLRKTHQAIDILFRIADIHIAAGLFLKATAAYKKAGKVDPSRLEVYERLGELYHRQGRTNEAVAQLSVLADFYRKEHSIDEAQRLSHRVAELRNSGRTGEVLTNRIANPVAGLPIAGVPIVRTKADMVVFLCHASEDKAYVRELYQQLRRDGFQPWLDENDLLPGQKWETEIHATVRRSHVVLICLSARSVTKAGFLQKEIKAALDVLDEQPEGIIFIIPVKVEHCDVPTSLRHLHYVDLFNPDGYSRLHRALTARAAQLGFVQTAG